MFAFPSYLQASCREPCGGSINVRVVRMLPFLPLCIDIMLDSTGSLATRFRCNAMGWTFGYHMQERRVTGMKGNGHASSGLVPAESSHISGIFDIACIDEGTPNETTARTIETYIQGSRRESGPLRALTYRCLSMIAVRNMMNRGPEDAYQGDDMATWRPAIPTRHRYMGR